MVLFLLWKALDAPVARGQSAATPTVSWSALPTYTACTRQPVSWTVNGVPDRNISLYIVADGNGIVSSSSELHSSSALATISAASASLVQPSLANDALEESGTASSTTSRLVTTPSTSSSIQFLQTAQQPQQRAPSSSATPAPQIETSTLQQVQEPQSSATSEQQQLQTTQALANSEASTEVQTATQQQEQSSEAPPPPSSASPQAQTSETSQPLPSITPSLPQPQDDPPQPQEEPQSQLQDEPPQPTQDESPQPTQDESPQPTQDEQQQQQQQEDLPSPAATLTEQSSDQPASRTESSGSADSTEASTIETSSSDAATSSTESITPSISSTSSDFAISPSPESNLNQTVLDAPTLATSDAVPLRKRESGMSAINNDLDNEFNWLANVPPGKYRFAATLPNQGVFRIISTSDVFTVVAGSDSSCIKGNGTVWAAGNNAGRQKSSSNVGKIVGGVVGGVGGFIVLLITLLTCLVCYQRRKRRARTKRHTEASSMSFETVSPTPPPMRATPISPPPPEPTKNIYTTIPIATPGVSPIGTPDGGLGLSRSRSPQPSPSPSPTPGATGMGGGVAHPMITSHTMDFGPEFTSKPVSDSPSRPLTEMQIGDDSGGLDPSSNAYASVASLGTTAAMIAVLGQRWAAGSASLQSLSLSDHGVDDYIATNSRTPAEAYKDALRGSPEPEEWVTPGVRTPANPLDRSPASSLTPATKSSASLGPGGAMNSPLRSYASSPAMQSMASLGSQSMKRLSANSQKRLSANSHRLGNRYSTQSLKRLSDSNLMTVPQDSVINPTAGPSPSLLSPSGGQLQLPPSPSPRYSPSPRLSSSPRFSPSPQFVPLPVFPTAQYAAPQYAVPQYAPSAMRHDIGQGYSMSTNGSVASSTYLTVESDIADNTIYAQDSTPRGLVPPPQQPQQQLSLPYGSATSFATTSFVSAYSQPSVYSASPNTAAYSSAMLSPVPSVPSVTDGTMAPFPSPLFTTLPTPLQGRPKSMPLSQYSEGSRYSVPERTDRDTVFSVSSPGTPVTPYTPQVPQVPTVPQVPSVPSSPIPPRKPPPTGPLPATPSYPPSPSMPSLKRDNSRRPLPPAMTDELRQILRQSQQKAREEDERRTSIPIGGSLGRNSIPSPYKTMDGKASASVDGLPQQQQQQQGFIAGAMNMNNVMAQHHQNHTSLLDPPDRTKRESYASFKSRHDQNKF